MIYNLSGQLFGSLYRGRWCFQEETEACRNVVFVAENKKTIVHLTSIPATVYYKTLFYGLFLTSLCTALFHIMTEVKLLFAVYYFTGFY